MLTALQYGTGGSALLLGLLNTAGTVQLWQVYALCFTLGCFAAMEMPVRQSFVPEMVGTDRVGNAVALNSVIVNFARIAGPGVAGYLIAWIGTGWLFLLNAGSVCSVIVALLLMDASRLQRGDTGTQKGQRFVDSLSYVRQRKDLVLVLILVFCMGTFGNNFNTTLPVMARQVFHLGSGGFGLLHTMLAVGTFTGAAVAAGRSTRRRPTFCVLVGSAVLFGSGEIVAALMPGAFGFAAVLVVVGAAQMMFILTANNMVQLSVDGMVRGRVMALYMLLLQGGIPFGSMISGWVAVHVDNRAPMVIGGTLSVLAAASCGLMSRKIFIRRRR